APGLVEQAGGQARPQGVQLQLGDQALEAEDEPAIRSRRVVDAILVADQALAVATEVEELIPVGAVTGPARDVVGEDDADVLQGDEGDEFLKAGAPLAGAGATAEVGVDDADPGRAPAGGAGATLEGIL